MTANIHLYMVETGIRRDREIEGKDGVKEKVTVTIYFESWKGNVKKVKASTNPERGGLGDGSAITQFYSEKQRCMCFFVPLCMEKKLKQ